MFPLKHVPAYRDLNTQAISCSGFFSFHKKINIVGGLIKSFDEVLVFHTLAMFLSVSHEIHLIFTTDLGLFQISQTGEERGDFSVA